MPNMEELLNQKAVEIIIGRTMPLLISKVGLDYAYGRMKLSEATIRHCVFATTEDTLTVFTDFKRFYVLADIPTILPEKNDRTLEYTTPA